MDSFNLHEGSNQLLRVMMKRTAVALAILLSICQSAYSQKVVLPKEVAASTGQWIVIAPKELDGGIPKYRASKGLDEVDLSAIFPPELLAKAKGKVWVASNPGVYTLEAWNAKGDVASDISTCTITIGKVGNGSIPSPSGQLWVWVIQNDGPLLPAHADLIKKVSSAITGKARFTKVQHGQAGPDVQAAVEGKPFPIFLLLREETRDGATALKVVPGTAKTLLMVEDVLKSIEEAK